MSSEGSTEDVLDTWDVVVVPFPFTDRLSAKRRPALVLSNGQFNSSGHSVLAMITTAAKTAWPSDTRIADLAAAGLRVPCVVRCNLFTLDTRLVLHTIGRLADDDVINVEKQLRNFLP